MSSLPPPSSWHTSDPSLRMLGWIRGLPAQIGEATDDWPDAEVAPQAYRGVVAAAMGGSAMASQVALGVAYPHLPTAVVRADTLPTWIGEGWLCLACSYSGNTRETLSCFDEALARGCTVCAVSSGGVLEDQARSRGLLFRRLRPGQPPRTAVGQTVAGLLWIMQAHAVAPDPREHLHEAAGVVASMWSCGLGAPEPWETEAGRIARAVRGSYTLVVGSPTTSAAALRWSHQLGENAKLPCFALEVPEMLHNHVEALDAAARAGATLVALTDPDLSPVEAAALDYLVSLHESAGGVAFRVFPRGASRLARTFSLMYLGDQVSYLASLLRGMDPTPVERIGHLKGVLDTHARRPTARSQAVRPG